MHYYIIRFVYTDKATKETVVKYSQKVITNSSELNDYVNDTLSYYRKQSLSEPKYTIQREDV